MSIVTKMLREKAVYWAMVGVDDQGQPMFGLPVEIDCRWEHSKGQTTNANNVTVTYNDLVYVDRDMEPGEVLWQGLLEDLDTNTILPNNLPKALPILKFAKVPNMRATEWLRRAYL